MRLDVMKELRLIENNHDITILYAVESGSRMFGYAHAGSDHDIRFIYKRKLRDYVRLHPQPDTIDGVAGLDFHGWDIQKALRLYQKSNPGLAEWLFASVRYLESTSLIADMRVGVADMYSLKALGFHYWNMALQNIQRTDGRNAGKRHIHFVRGLLNVLYLIQQQQSPPLKIQELTDLVDLPVELEKGIAAFFEHVKTGGRTGLSGDVAKRLEKLLRECEPELEGLPQSVPPSDLLDNWLWEEIKS